MGQEKRLGTPTTADRPLRYAKPPGPTPHLHRPPEMPSLGVVGRDWDVSDSSYPVVSRTPAITATQIRLETHTAAKIPAISGN